MGSLAEQYYELVWKAVREGPQVVEEVFGPSSVLERRFYEASRREESVAFRFIVVTCFVARRILEELNSVIDELPDECNVAASLAGEALDLYSRLKRDLVDEIAEYKLSPGPHLLAMGVLEALAGLSRGIEAYCRLAS